MAKLQSNNSCVLHFLAKCWDPEVCDFQAACWYKARTKDGANPANPRCGESAGLQTVAIKRREVSNSRIVFVWIFRTFVWEMQHSTIKPNGANSNLPQVTDPLLSNFVSHTCTASLLKYGDNWWQISPHQSYYRNLICHAVVTPARSSFRLWHYGRGLICWLLHKIHDFGHFLQRISATLILALAACSCSVENSCLDSDLAHPLNYNPGTLGSAL